MGRLKFIAILAVLLVNGIALLVIWIRCQLQTPPHQHQSECDKLYVLDLTDGVSRSEAMIISQCYSERHLGAGPIDGVEDGGNYWRILFRLGGWLAKPSSFEIDKRTGKILSSAVGPGYETPFDMTVRPNNGTAADRHVR